MMLWLLCTMMAFAEEHEVVVSPKKEDLELTKREVKQMFTRQRVTWKDDQLLTVVLPLMDSPAMLWLSRNVLGLPPEVYHRYLLEKAYRAGEDPPLFVATPSPVNGQIVLTVVPQDNYSVNEYSIIHIR